MSDSAQIENQTQTKKKVGNNKKTSAVIESSNCQKYFYSVSIHHKYHLP